MKLKLVRDTYTEESTTGKLYIDGVFFCYVLEDKVRSVNEKRIFGKTAIPTGIYRIAITFSDRFQQQMPLLLNVPHYEGVRAHWGSFAKDTEGCLLVGDNRSKDFINGSKVTYAKLFTILKKADKVGKITIEIVNTEH